MSCPRPPTHPLTLPSSILTIPDPRISNTNFLKTSSTSTSTIASKTSSPAENPAIEPHQPIGLRIKITPHILIPTPLISPAVTGRKVEGCVDVMVPLGGRVEVRIHVGEGSGEVVAGLSQGLEAVLSAEEEVRNLVRSCMAKFLHPLTSRGQLDPSSLVQNAGTLSLVSAETSTTTSSSLSPSEQHDDGLSTTVTLVPHSSSAPEASRLGLLVPTGHPIAFLTRLDLSFTWAPAVSRAAQWKPRAASMQGGTSESQASNQTSEMEESPDDDMELVLDDEYAHELGRCGEALDEDEMIIIDDCDDENMGQSSDFLGSLPGWAKHQLDQGLKKVFRVHMIRRFPLIFDAGLLDAGRILDRHSSSLQLPRGMTTALNRYLTLSAGHNTPFLKASKRHLKAIVREQESQLKDKVAQVVELPTNKRRFKELAQKKRKVQEGIKAAYKAQKKTQALSSEFEATEPGKDPVSLEASDPQERALAYIAELRRRFEEDVEGTNRADEARLTRILGEATGRIGREQWEELRRGMGKLAWWKVQLLGVDSSPIVQSADPADDSNPRDGEPHSMPTLQRQTQARRATELEQPPLCGGSVNYGSLQLSILGHREDRDDEDEDEDNDLDDDDDDDQILDDDDDPWENGYRYEDEDNEEDNEEGLLLDDEDEMDEPITPSPDFGHGGARGCEEWPDEGEEEMMMLEDDLDESDADPTCQVLPHREVWYSTLGRSTGLPLGRNGDIVDATSYEALMLMPSHQPPEAHLWDDAPNADHLAAAGTAIIREKQDMIALLPGGIGPPFIPTYVDSLAYWGDKSPSTGGLTNATAAEGTRSFGPGNSIDAGAPGLNYSPPASLVSPTSHWPRHVQPKNHTEDQPVWQALDDFDDEDW